MTLTRRLLLLLVPALCAPLSAQESSLQLVNDDVGTSGYVRVARDPGLELQEFTLEAWIEPNGPGVSTGGPSGRFIAGIPQEGVSGSAIAPYGLHWNSATHEVYGYLSTETGSGVSTYCICEIEPGCRVHAAMTFEGSTLSLYLNGRLQSSEQASLPGITYYGNDFLIGAANYAFGYLRRYDGKVEEVRVWDYARNEEELGETLNCSLTGTETGLVAYWDFTDGSLADRTGHGHDGIAVGTGVGFAAPFVDHDLCGEEFLTFSRGDCNDDGMFNLADAVFGLATLFTGGSAAVCDDACDSNDDGTFNISDPVWMLSALFLSGAPQPLAPFPCCDVDPTPDTLPCAVSSNCP